MGLVLAAMPQTVYAGDSVGLTELAQVVQEDALVIEQQEDKKRGILEQVIEYEELLKEQEEELRKQEETDKQEQELLAKKLETEWIETLLTLNDEDSIWLHKNGVQIKTNEEGWLNHLNELNKVGYIKEDSPLYIYHLTQPTYLDDELTGVLDKVLSNKGVLIVMGTKEHALDLNELLGDKGWYQFQELPEGGVTIPYILATVQMGVKLYEENSNKIVTADLPENTVNYNGVIFKTYPTVPGQSTFNFGFDDPAYANLIGRAHSGVDISYTSSLRDIYSVDEGVITRIQTGCAVGGRDCGGGYGNFVEVSHPHLPGNMKTLYAHLSSTDVAVGQQVKAGQVIGQMGTTGRSDGVHLHFEVFANNSKVNPMNYINFNTYSNR